MLILPDGREHKITHATLAILPQTTVSNYAIVSTGHGTSGPFAFGGVTLFNLLQSYLSVVASTCEVEVYSADGFGNRVMGAELQQPSVAGPILLSTHIDGRIMTRQEGAVRLIVPSEKNNALRQVKWVGRIVVKQN